VVDFRTHKVTVDDRVVAALNMLYDGKPVGSRSIGQAVAGQRRQVFKKITACREQYGTVAGLIEAGPADPVIRADGCDRRRAEFRCRRYRPAGTAT
jgi:hypothetical protein